MLKPVSLCRRRLFRREECMQRIAVRRAAAVLIVGAVAAGLGWTAIAQAQAPAAAPVARLADGHPDLSGLYVAGIGGGGAVCGLGPDTSSRCSNRAAGASGNDA